MPPPGTADCGIYTSIAASSPLHAKTRFMASSAAVAGVAINIHRAAVDTIARILCSHFASHDVVPWHVAGTDELIATTPALANPGTERTSRGRTRNVRFGSAKRTLLGERVMSAPDPKRTKAGLKSRSAVGFREG